MIHAWSRKFLKAAAATTYIAGLGYTYTNNTQEPTDLERKVAQTAVCHVNTKENLENVKKLCKNQPRGFILYNWANDINTIQETQALTNAMREVAKGPIIICLDEEGGRVNRVKELQTMDQRTKAQQLTQDHDLYNSYFELGKALKNIGIDINLAPVVDVDSNPKNPVIGNRSFSNDAQEVTRCGKIAVDGLLASGILPCLKHFPGHGDTNEDSHKALARVHKTLTELKETELAPFKALAEKAPMIMTAHIMTAFDEKYCATLSKKTLDYLRNECNFKGVIVADSVTMKGVLMNANPEDKTCDTISTKQIATAAVGAIKAGCDLIILGGKELNKGNPIKELTPDQVNSIIKNIAKEIQAQGLEKELERAHSNVEKLMQKIETINLNITDKVP